MDTDTDFEQLKINIRQSVDEFARLRAELARVRGERDRLVQIGAGGGVDATWMIANMTRGHEPSPDVAAALAEHDRRHNS